MNSGIKLGEFPGQLLPVRNQRDSCLRTAALQSLCPHILSSFQVKSNYSIFNASVLECGMIFIKNTKPQKYIKVKQRGNIKLWCI